MRRSRSRSRAPIRRACSRPMRSSPTMARGRRPSFRASGSTRRSKCRTRILDARRRRRLERAARDDGRAIRGQEALFREFQARLAKIRQTLIAQFAVGPLASKNAQLAAFIERERIRVVGAQMVRQAARRIERRRISSLVATSNNPRDYAPGTSANAERVHRIEKYLAGLCERRGLADVWLENCGEPPA